ncbi:hypothetical protein R4681_17670 [Acinetobacter baumannii]|nr:hypothetical protein [Acinetobacter baumannii]
MKLIFNFDDKQDKFIAGFIYNLLENIFTCALFLCVYFVTYITKFEKIGIIFFILFAFSVINLGKFYALAVYSLAERKNKSFSKFDFGSLVSLLLFLGLIIFIGSIKFHLFPVTTKSIGILYFCLLFAIVALIGNVILPHRLGYEKVSFTTQKDETSNKKFYIEKLKFNVIRVIMVIVPVVIMTLALKYFLVPL